MRYLTKLNRIKDKGAFGSRLALVAIPALLIVIPILYLITLAQGLVLGDPTEFTFVANKLGIAHPPGYAFITLLGKLFQTLNPFGDIPWRMHLLAAAAATLATLFVYGSIVAIARGTQSVSRRLGNWVKVIALFAALAVATGADFWQHAIHTNPHIITAAFLSANLFFLTMWWAGKTRSDGKETQQDNRSSSSIKRNDRWLYGFCFSAGLGITHHPLTAIGFLAYGLFILWVQPGIWREWRTLLKMVAFALLGLSIWLYFPIRSAMQPVFGPHDMNTLDGFLNHVLARGITESLPFFGPADLADRATVFWTLLRLQYSLPLIFLALFGLAWLLFTRLRARDSRSTLPVGVLYGLALLSNYAFVINLRQQDIMAYLLGVFLMVGLLAGIGLLGLLDLLQRRTKLDKTLVALLIAGLFLLGPVLQTVRNLPRISLRNYREGDDYVEAVFDFFENTEEGAVLLNDWEHMTPLWYSHFVDGRWPDAEDIQPRLVATARPWVESVFDFLPGGPVYLSGYRPEIVNAGFRLRPRGPFYQVIEPGDASLPPEITPVQEGTAGAIEIAGYHLPISQAAAGDFVPLTLAMRTIDGSGDFYTPVLYIGDGPDQVTLEFTTDSHLTTPSWQPGEIIVERFDFALPHNTAGGRYPLTLGVRNLSTSEDTELMLPLGELVVSAQDHHLPTNHLLANFRQRVGLVSAIARNGLLEKRTARWDDPMVVEPGDTVHLTLEWESLAPAEESYTIFVHLIDQSNRPLVALDYTPLGGSTPTHLWIPKWMPGQRMLDPYQMEIPAGLAPGTYFIEVGLYEMTSGRRLHMSDEAGNLIGDRFILGPIVIEE